ncbi:MAG: hypothetical protein LBV80_00385 [Deltaproteobacteria bacterium]|jgi:hypothetical protein|nr:hypothetical protein [Deltaproteobacteria bacterium]
MEIGSTGIMKNTLGDSVFQEFLAGKASSEAINQAAATVNSGVDAGADAAANVGPAVVQNFSEAARYRSDNLMSGNFVGSYEESEYLAATKQGLADRNRTEMVRDFDLMAFMTEETKAEIRKHGSEQAQRITKAREAMQAAEQSLNEFKAVMAEQTEQAMQDATAADTQNNEQNDSRNDGRERAEDIATGAAGSAAANPQIAAAAATAYAPATAQVTATAAEMAAAATVATAPSAEGGASSGQGVAKVSVNVSV